jgi:hypothetical protein
MNVQPDNYPFAGNPRIYRAVAMPNGDARFGIAGPLVLMIEQRKYCVDKPRLLTRAEAEGLRNELDAALRAFDLAKDFVRVVAEEMVDRPRAYHGPWPTRSHPTLADAFEANSEAV